VSSSVSVISPSFNDFIEPQHEAPYFNNRRDAIENIVDDDPVAVCVREIMADRAQWTGSACDLLRAGPMLPAIPWFRTGLAGQRIPAHSLAGVDASARTFIATKLKPLEIMILRAAGACSTRSRSAIHNRRRTGRKRKCHRIPGPSIRQDPDLSRCRPELCSDQSMRREPREFVSL
jgi:hypothetical protein